MGRVGRFILKVAAVLILIVSAGTFALSLFTGETLEGFRYVDTSGSDLSAVEKEVQIQKQTAPVKKGDQIGEVIYRLNEKTIGSVPVYATEGVGELTFGGAFLKILEEMMV